MVNAADIPTSDRESSSKTDPIDSRKIAKALRANLLTSIHVSDLVTEGDRQLFRYRKRLQADQTRVKNRIKDKFLFTGIPIPEEFDNPNWSKRFLHWLRKVHMPDPSTRLTLDRLLDQYDFLHKYFLKVSIEVRKLQLQARYRKQAKLLRTIPGIGPLTTVELLCEIEDIQRFPSFKKFNGFIGFRPYSHSSGEHDWKGSLTYRRLCYALCRAHTTLTTRMPVLRFVCRHGWHWHWCGFRRLNFSFVPIATISLITMFEIAADMLKRIRCLTLIAKI